MSVRALSSMIASKAGDRTAPELADLFTRRVMSSVSASLFGVASANANNENPAFLSLPTRTCFYSIF
jgi:hypothetical protein